jgi:alkanesulfonate monooxygenase SsuD/methylene tetrahydromethanopterin reductase-like flavin-dependent oxidoreductase (luciferase family)
MTDQRPAPQFGISIDPATDDLSHAFRRARIADTFGLDLITIMDHPYNANLLDTWTLLTALAMRTERVHVGTNVLCLPLRSPALLAKMAATLDVLTEGRVELGLGAGAFWDGIAAWGVPRRTPGKAYQAFYDALHILRGLWDHAGDAFSYTGEVYSVDNAILGPTPPHRIPIWVGAGGPRMLRLVGRMADGLFLSRNYVPPKNLLAMNKRVDAGAQEVGRDPAAIRRGYNLMGMLNLSRDDTKVTGLKPEFVSGTVDDWVAQIVTWVTEFGMDTFIFWPIGGNKIAQIEVFAQEVAPAVKAALGA